MYHFLLHQVETHRDQCHTQHQIHGAYDEADIQTATLVDLITWHYIPETDRTQRYETKVGAVEEVPRLPF